jgi:hypothetical protein
VVRGCVRPSGHLSGHPAVQRETRLSQGGPRIPPHFRELTKLRKVFSKDEISDDLEFVRAKVGEKDDNIDYFSILPTSPP